MLVAAASFLTHSTSLVLGSILLMGLQSALFSPSKYGLIRDIGGEEGISFGSGAMEMFAFVGILTGTLMAAFLSESVDVRSVRVLFGVALFGWLASLTIRANESEPMRESHETLNPVKFVKDMFLRAKAFKGLNLIVVGLATFWFIGAMIQMVLIVYCRSDLGMSDSETGIVMSLAAIGIGSGCYLAGVLSRHDVELGLVPCGGITTGLVLLTIFIFDAGRGILCHIGIPRCLFQWYVQGAVGRVDSSKREGTGVGRYVGLLELDHVPVYAFCLGMFRGDRDVFCP